MKEYTWIYEGMKEYTWIYEGTPAMTLYQAVYHDGLERVRDEMNQGKGLTSRYSSLNL